MTGSYGVIYADPPWHFKTWSAKGRGRTADAWYDTLSLDAIKQLPVAGWGNETDAFAGGTIPIRRRRADMKDYEDPLPLRRSS